MHPSAFPTDPAPELTVAEELVLIALDDETGGGRLRLGLDWAVAGAAILELALTERIVVGEGDVITVLDPASTGAAHLDAVITEAAGGVKVSKALRRTRNGAPGGVIASLVRRGVLQRRRAWLLGVIPAHRYPMAAGIAAKVEIRARIARTVLDGQEPDDRTAALIGVLHAAKLCGRAVPSGERKQVRRRMREIAEGQSVSPAVRKAIVRTRAAIAAMAAASSGG